MKPPLWPETQPGESEASPGTRRRDVTFTSHSLQMGSPGQRSVCRAHCTLMNDKLFILLENLIHRYSWHIA
jgi:hypothetical protein